MRYGDLIIEIREFEKLKRIIAGIPGRIDASYRASVKKFQKEMETAKKVLDSDMPHDIVRFNSIATIRDASGNLFRYQVVSPEQSNISKGRISVIAPMGLALFGYAEKDEVKWQFPGGMQVLKIVKVEQADQQPSNENTNEKRNTVTSKP